MRLAALVLIAVLAAGTGRADPLTLDGDFSQGGLVRGKAPPGTLITLGDRAVKLTAAGDFIIGFGRDHDADATLVAVYPDGGRQSYPLTIAKSDYRIERIDGLPQKMVTPPQEELDRIRREGATIAATRATDSDETWFLGDWDWPAKGRVSGWFGSQRILNGTPGRPHYGMDIAAPPGSPVAAPAPGRVLLATTGYYFTGGTVVLDHGHGLTSLYMHLSRIDVKPGDVLAKGDRLGAVGATGRATGPHLDWRVNWFNERLDPQRLLPPPN